MTADRAFRLEEQTAAAVDALATFASRLRLEDLPRAARTRLDLLLTDLLGVTVAGMRTPELQALTTAWRCSPGSARLPGTAVRTTPETAALLTGSAACVLELDEGNKHALGHPAAHVVPAAVAAAQLRDDDVPGDELLTAVAAGYEVAARFGRATHRDPAWHTHGHWGATGAACAAALLLGADRSQVAAAVDASTGLMHVTPWATVLAGDFTRNLWAAGANLAGLHAARLAVAGLVQNRGAAQHSLGSLVGSLDPSALAGDVGERWLLTEGYLKRHASCSYTHPAVDLVLALHGAQPLVPDEIAQVRVRTTSLAASLLARHPQTRLAAMFSLPFVVSTAVVNGRVDPGTMEPGSAAFRAAEEFSERVTVVLDPALDAHLPRLRCTEVEVERRDGGTVALAAPNPVGDADHFPLGAQEVWDKLAALLGQEDADQVVSVVGALSGSPSVAEVLDQLP